MLALSEKPLETRKKHKANSNEPAMVAALKKLTEEMAAGKLKSGQALKESVLAKEYGLSRNAIREALNQIVGWGLFEYVPYCGYQIKKFTIHNLLQWDELREAVEPIAARRLAKNRPPEALKVLKKYCDDMEKAYKDMNHSAFVMANNHFHLCVVENCGNDCFSQLQTISNLAACFYFGRSILESVREITEFRYIIEGFNKDDDIKKRLGSTLDAHRRMSGAIFAGDTERAEEIFRIHTRNLVKSVEKYIDMVTQFK